MSTITLPKGFRINPLIGLEFKLHDAKKKLEKVSKIHDDSFDEQETLRAQIEDLEEKIAKENAHQIGKNMKLFRFYCDKKNENPHFYFYPTEIRVKERDVIGIWLDGVGVALGFQICYRSILMEHLKDMKPCESPMPNVCKLFEQLLQKIKESK